MEFCYPGCDRKCVCGGKEQKCFMCGKIISDCEWVINWESCAECFDKPRNIPQEQSEGQR